MSSASSLQPSDKRLLFFDSPTCSVFVCALPSVAVVSAGCFSLSDTGKCSKVELVCGVLRLLFVICDGLLHQALSVLWIFVTEFLKR